MRRVTIRGLQARKLRLALTALAIVLGVTFVTGTLVLGDTLNRTFDDLVGTAYQHVSFQIRGKAVFDNNAVTAVGSTTNRKPIPESIATSVRRLPGVAFVYGSVAGYAQFMTRDGNAIGSGGGSTLGFSFDPNPRLSPYRLVEGRAPTTADDVVMDKASATKHHFEVGDRVLVNLPDRPQTFTISGIVTFGADDNLAGVTLAGFALPTAQKVFDSRGRYDTISVLAAPGADDVRLQRSIAGVLPPGVEVISGQTVANELSSAVNNALSFISTALLIFAFISLFVGAFTIYNTFAITVGQRTRELALLRVVGASRRQVFRSVLGEAALTGLIASADRPGSRRRCRDRAQGAPQGVRHHAALGAAGVRGPHGGGGDRRRSRRDRALGDRPGASRRADPSGRGAGRARRGPDQSAAAAASDRRRRRCPRRGRRPRRRRDQALGRAGGGRRGWPCARPPACSSRPSPDRCRARSVARWSPCSARPASSGGRTRPATHAGPHRPRRR